MNLQSISRIDWIPQVQRINLASTATPSVEPSNNEDRDEAVQLRSIDNTLNKAEALLGVAK